MRSILRRIEKLESGWTQAAEGGIHLFVKRAGLELALDSNRCVEILRQCGFSPSVIRLGKVPPGLNAKELERYLCEHGAEICSPSVRQGQPLQGIQ
jgi:hypothetical protein